MNYIELLNHFWRMRRKMRFSHAEVDLYFYLLKEANELFWQNPFPHPTKQLSVDIGMTNKTLIEARNKLKQKGLIDFKDGNRNAETPFYTLLFAPLLCAEKETFGNQKGNQPRNQKGNQKGNPLKRIQKTETNTSFEQKKSAQDFLERAEQIPLPEKPNVPAHSPTAEDAQPDAAHTVNPKLVKSIPLETLFEDAALMTGSIPPEFIEAWWLKYEAEGWMTGGQFPKPIFKPAAKIRQHWLDGKLMPNARAYGEERSASVPVWNGKANNGANPDEELSLEFDGEIYVFKRRDCNYNGEIVNQDHPHFNEIQMAQMLGGSLNAKGAVN